MGQHWLEDQLTLESICRAAGLNKADTVLEIGPGRGSLTTELLQRARRVVAVELDDNLALQLSARYSDHNLEVVNQDILRFDLTSLPSDYKVVANIPYYLTSTLLRVLAQSQNPPEIMVLLVQKEVAERICAAAGRTSLLSVSVQLYYEAQLGQIVPAKLFRPPPKVDSRVVILKRRTKTLLGQLSATDFFEVVKAGFSNRRKKLRSSISGGLAISKNQADQLLKQAGIDGNLRAQNLSLKQWRDLAETWTMLKQNPK